jgi:hypothetical protein
MKRTIGILKLIAVATGVTALLACNPVAKGDRSPSLLIIESITGTTAAGETASYLESDVQKIGQSGAYTTTDNATAILRASLLNPDSLTGPSQYNNIILTGYTVNYELPDGTGTPGTDVPRPLAGQISTTMVEIGKSVTVSIQVVLDTAKLQAPLAQLAQTTNTLQVNAIIEFIGEDLTGKEVRAEGKLVIIFGDYPDD